MLTLLPSYDALLRTDLCSLSSFWLVFGEIIDGEEILNREWTSLDLSLAHPTAYAANLTSLAYSSTRFMIVARTDILSTVWHELYDIIRTNRNAFTACNALLLIDNDIALLIL